MAGGLALLGGKATWSDDGGGEHHSKTVELPKHFACDSRLKRGVE